MFRYAPQLIFVIACLAAPNPALSSGGANVLLSHFISADYLLGQCGPAILGGVPKSGFDQRYEAFKNALVARTVKLNPHLTSRQARVEIDKVIARRTNKFGPALNRINCDTAKIDRLIRIVRILVSESFEAELDKYQAEPPLYDQQRSVNPSVSAPKTFAYPALIRALVQAMSQQIGKSPCADLRVEEIEFVTRRKTDARSVPMFVLPPITYDEYWIVQCDGKRIRYEVQFSQDSEGSEGRFPYKIKLLK